MWNQLHLKQSNKTVSTCYKGNFLPCMNLDAAEESECNSWHFHPKEREKALKERYDSIIRSLSI